MNLRSINKGKTSKTKRSFGKSDKRVSPEDVKLVFVYEGEEYVFDLLEIQEHGWPMVDDEPVEVSEVLVKS